MHTYAVDFETYYDAEYSLKEISAWNYVFNKKFDAYLMAVIGEGFSWAGNPRDFDWPRFNGARICAHNVVGMEGLIFRRLKEDGIIPGDVEIAEWFDTADMAAFLRTQRNLKDASKFLLGRDISKAPLSKMKGKQWVEMEAEGLAPLVKQYCLDDTQACYDLWKTCSDQWPTEEQEFSRINREECWKGVHVNRGAVEAAVQTLGVLHTKALQRIPWTDDYKPLSPHGIRRQGRIEGIPVPASLAKDKPEVIAWMAEYAEKFPWVKAVQDYRALNTFYSRAKNLLENIRDDGTAMFQVKYHGANTGRDSAGSEGDSGEKFNIKNQTKDVVYGVDFRGFIIPPPGELFIVSDYAQIEPRLLYWRVGDNDILDRIRAGVQIYQAHAEATMGWDPAVNLKQLAKTDSATELFYNRVKGRVIGAGYQCGAKTYMRLAEKVGLFLTMGQAKVEIDGYRDQNPRIVNFWKEHQKWLMWSVNHQDATHVVELASGRKLTYYEPHRDKFGIMATDFRGGRTKHLYGGILTENEIQATARDVLRDSMIALDKAGINHVFTAYDEVISSAPADQIEEAKQEQEHLMSTTVTWLPGCPLNVESAILDHYEKA